MKNKTVLIVIGIVTAVVVLVTSIFVITNNKAISLEEQIKESAASINTYEKRRQDLVYNLADAVKSYTKYESDTLEKITKGRTDSADADIKQATVDIKAVAEAYPELKANETYTKYMNELSLTENQIAQYRENYNIQVKSYNKMIRKFPASLILRIMGYEELKNTYLEFDASKDAPQNLL